ncbi:helix-turn-helix transcriptional regulator [Vibrio sp. 10N]|uniref:helix-turn-helix transcriptional regulator n=1 Tax=Vibrio sp. 10N TaxID=3058938 RepID=UPI0028129C08|nr:AraC family transcriptional regulator [Vibrio sp. 10N]
MSKEEFCHLASFEAFDGMDVINAQFVDTTFGKHAHGEFVITLVDAGVQQFFHKGATHNAISGDICIISPDEIHTGSKGCEQGWRYRGIYPSEQQVRDIYKEMYSKDGLPTFRDSIISDDRLKRQMHLLLSTIHSGGEQLEIESHLELLLVKMILQYGSSRLTNSDGVDAKSNIITARDYLADNCTKKVALDQLAQLTGVSKYHLIHEFKRHLGVTPHQFQVQQRICYSKSLLKAGDKPVDVATACGFHDQSHFHKTFVSAMGINPTTYQQQFFTR